MSVIWSGVTEEGAIVPVQVTAEGKVVAVGDGPVGEYLPITGGELTGDLEVDGSITAAGAGSVTAPQIRYLNNNPAGRSNVIAIYNATDGTETFPTFQVDSNGTTRIGQYLTNAPKIELNSAAGSATFTGKVDVGGEAYAGTANGVDIEASGALYVSNTSNGNIWLGYTTGSSSITSSITGKGDATFAGTLTAAGGVCGFTAAGELVFTSRGSRYKLVVAGELCTAEPYTRAMELREKADQFIADKRETKPSEPLDPQPEVTTDNDNA